ncbi:MAG: hypothetical protein AAB459_04170, partial [Patescibacteria group bacterium]
MASFDSPDLSEISWKPVINFSNEFGVNLCSENQNILSNVSGGSSGKNVNKIKVLEELDFNFYK